MKINHYGIEVFDIYRMELFYKNTFGFNTKYRYISKNTPGLKTVMLEKDGAMIELLQRDVNECVSGNNKEGNMHISLFVDNVNKEYERINSIIKIDLKEPRTTGDGFLEFSFKDPEGNIVEIGRRINKFNDYKIKAIIFDLDGTLIDSEENYYLADKKLLNEYGIELTLEMKHKYVGIGNYQMMKDLKQRYVLNQSVEYLTSIKNEYYLEIARKNTKIFPEMKKFLDMLKDNGFPMAIASGSSLSILDELVPLVQLDDYCKVVVSADQVNKGKPAPDIFLEAAERLGVLPENCLVLEDSKYGVEAAKRAFMYCMSIPYINDDLDENFFMADKLYKNGMKDFNAKKAFHWIKKINTKE